MKKIVVVGEPAVGKTSLRKRYLGAGFSSNYMSTIGADFSFATHTTNEGKEEKFSIWDIAGEQTYLSIRSQFYSGAFGVILVFDISRPDTFYSLDHWVAELKANMVEKIRFVAVGNKEDLREMHDEVVTGDDIARRIPTWESILGVNIPVYYTSALTGLNVEQVFSELLKEIPRESK